VANWDNESTKVVQEDMQAIFDRGMVEGYEYTGRFNPDFFSKPYYLLKPSERGFILGYEVRKLEREEESS